MNIVGLVGFIGSGKGSVADILVEKHGYIKESFANGVKDAVATIFGWDRKDLEGDTVASREWRERIDPWWSEKMGKEFSPRIALQLMGTEAGRDVFHPDLWVYSMLRRCNPNKKYVIADVRFPNEIKMIRDYGGVIYRVTRGPNPEWYQTAIMYNMEASTIKPDVHFSEWAWIGSPIDGNIDNNATLNDLEKLVDLIA